MAMFAAFFFLSLIKSLLKDIKMSTPVLAPKVAFILQVKVTFDPKDRDTFLKYFKPAYDAVIAEPECAYFFIGENIQEPGVFRWTEGWTKDIAWFMAEQINKPYYEPYLKATEPLFTSERVAEVYTPLEGMGHITMDL
ncbi:hypothetical protein DL95DRAFT_524799 [Leptodontidium sp. 2 PMI_412]|nr:hypothetical protein DL95DRAFT_524799 [Leptodontidium sp. 2 PMI_412]